MRTQFARQALAAIVCATLLYLPAGAQAPQREPLLGFSDEAAASQRQLEQRFDSLLKADNLREWMKFIAAHPHHVGSPHGKGVAEFIAEKFCAAATLRS